MNPWLNPHGIWYYRKVAILPCGRRKEFKKSLQTRDKLAARAVVAKLLACVRSRPKPNQLPADVTVDPQEQSVAQPTTPAAKPLAPLLSVLSDRYQKEKALSWAPKERKNQKNYLGSFIEALGDKPAAGYGKAHVVKFKEGLLNSGKSSATINKYLQKLSLLFSWLANHQEGIVNHFAGLKLQRVKETKARSGYTMEERQRFIQWVKRQEPYRRWIALLGLYTGARTNEICQLYADDVVLVDNIWCISVQSGKPDQKLKTDNRKRLIQIHLAGLEAGFLAFVQERVGGRLFVELPYRQDGYSHLWEQWFSRNRPVPKDFHSLRHTVASTLKDKSIPLQFAAAILGHTNGAIRYDRYGGGVAVEKLQAAIEAAL